MLAKRIDMDPLELRLKNATRPGTQTVYGPKMSHDGYAETFLQTAYRIGPVGRPRARPEFDQPRRPTTGV